MRAATGVLLWLVAAAAATTVGLVAVGAIGTDIFGANTQQPLSQSEVDRRLATPPPGTTTRPPTTTPSATPPPDTRPTGKTTAVPSAGGTVLARCVAGGVQVLGATPAQGYQVDHEEDDVDDHPHVRFRSSESEGDDDNSGKGGGDDDEVEVRLRCVGGVLRSEIRTD